MLQFMRQRASSWMIKAILSIIVLAFIFMGVGNFRDQNDIAAATVNGKKISVTQFQDRYYVLLEGARQQFGNQLNDDILKLLNLKERALDQLISETLLFQKARELGFDVSDQELSTSIRQMAYFQQDGHFSPELYNGILQRNRLTPENFEQMQKRELLTQKVKQLIDDSVKVSEDEARRWYNWQNSEIKIKVAIFAPDDFSPSTPSDDVLKQYFDEHKENYKTEEKVKVTYIRVDPADFTAMATVADDEIRQYYEDHRDGYSTEKTVEASHILIKMDPDAPEETVSAKEAEAMKIYDMVTSGQDFAACAEQYSEDAGSAAKGGALGAFTKKELVAPFAEQAFSMEAGDISRPVRTQFGWHIIRVEKVNEASVTPLSTATPEIEKKLALKQARDLAYEEALRVFDAAINKNSVTQAAEQLGLEAHTTPLFSRTDTLEGIQKNSAFIRQAFDLLEDEISDVVEVDGRYYLFQVDQRLAPAVPELVAVRERVLEDLTAQMREEQAKEAAETCLKALQTGAAIDEAVKETPAHLSTTDYFKRRMPVPEIGNEPELSREAFSLQPDDPVADKVLKGRKGYYVVFLEDRRPPAEGAFAAEKEKVTAQLMQLKKEDAFSAWMSAMKSESDITRDERVLN